MEPTANNIQPKKVNTAQSKVKGQELTSKPWLSETKKKANSTFQRSFDAINKTVNIKPLKSFVFQNFPKDSAIYDALFTERDLLGIHEFLNKMDVWTKLLRRI